MHLEQPQDNANISTSEGYAAYCRGLLNGTPWTEADFAIFWKELTPADQTYWLDVFQAGHDINIELSRSMDEPPKIDLALVERLKQILRMN